MNRLLRLWESFWEFALIWKCKACGEVWTSGSSCAACGKSRWWWLKSKETRPMNEPEFDEQIIKQTLETVVRERVTRFEAELREDFKVELSGKIETEIYDYVGNLTDGFTRKRLTQRQIIQTIIGAISTHGDE